MTPKPNAKSTTRPASRPPRRQTKRPPIEIMDTTLRDGEQCEGISLIPEEKLMIATQLLKKAKVDRIEITSAKASAGEQRGLKDIVKWAKSEKLLDRIEVLGFADGGGSVQWVHDAGAKVINLLTKGSEKHCREQLRQTLDQHMSQIARTVEQGLKRKIKFNVYLEDWSSGMLDSPDYVWAYLEALEKIAVNRIMLCDTLGVLNPAQVSTFVGEIVRAYPERHVDFHGHNDYGLATANTLAAIEAGAHGVHVTVNGMGERAGNTPLDEVVVGLRDHLKLKSNVKEKSLKDISRLVEIFSGRRISANKPITGENVFTQTAGIHADGDMKGDLYESRLSPARFGQARRYSMGKLMGKASLVLNLEKLNIRLDREQFKAVMDRIIELSDQKKNVTPADLPFLISDVLQMPEDRVFDVKDYSIHSSRSLPPTATIRVVWKGKDYDSTATGDGGYDAFMKALNNLQRAMGAKIPKLLDYEVHIPPGGKTDALVETTITWEGGLKTRGVDTDQLAAAIEATVHAVNLVAMEQKG